MRACAVWKNLPAVAAQAAKLKLEWVRLVIRETPPPLDFKTHEQIQKEKAALNASCVAES
jgi:hypothetical protein